MAALVGYDDHAIGPDHFYSSSGAVIVGHPTGMQGLRSAVGSEACFGPPRFSLDPPFRLPGSALGASRAVGWTRSFGGASRPSHPVGFWRTGVFISGSP